MGTTGPHETAQNRRDYVRWQPNPGRAEFFALPFAASPIRPFAFTSSFAKQLLQLLYLTAGDELFERLVIGSFGEIDFQDLLEQHR